MKKQLGLAALGLAGLTAGAGAGLVLTGGNGSAAAQTTPTTPDTTAPDSSAPDSSPETSAPDDGTTDRSSWLQDALAPLVEDGTITQAQADAVIAALQEARPERGHGPGHGGFGRGGRGFVSLDTVADALGVTADELRTQLRDGATIAEVAEAEGVDIDTVKDAMLEAFRAHQQEHVTSGELTQDQADANIAAFEERLDELVTNPLPSRPDRPGDAADHSSGTDADDEAPATTTG